MPTYTYKATDSKSKLIKGELQASGEIEVTTQLAKLGYMPITISLKNEKAPSSGGIFKSSVKVNPQALVIFTRQFATIIKAAIPIMEGLGALAEQTEDLPLKKALNQLVHDIGGGLSLSQAMAKHPNVFSDLYVNTVVAGESAGVLESVLFRLSNMLEDDAETKNNISAAFRYPIMVVIAMVIAIIVLSVFVIPQFAKIYSDAKVALPLPTQIMIIAGYALKNYWYITFPSIAAGAFGFKKFINTKKGRFWWDGQKFKMLIVGKIYTKITMLRFASMLSVLYQAGLPVLKTMDIVALTIGNVVLSKEIEKIKHDVSDGKGISGAVLNSKFFPRLVGYMISVGEKSGSLGLMLDSLCQFFESEVRSMVRNLTTMIEPIMTAILGVVVMGMCLAIFLPLWSMIQVVKGGG